MNFTQKKLQDMVPSVRVSEENGILGLHGFLSDIENASSKIAESLGTDHVMSSHHRDDTGVYFRIVERPEWEKKICREYKEKRES